MMMNPLHQISALLAADPAPPTGMQGILGNPMMMMGLLFVMFYFLLIRPQQKQRKEQLARIAALQQGDKVITGSGIYGLIHNVKDKTVTIKVAEGVMIEFDKSAVATVLKKDA